MSLRLSLTFEQVHILNAALDQFKQTGCVGCPRFNDCEQMTIKPCMVLWAKLNPE
jgi:hypothetical protein